MYLRRATYLVCGLILQYQSLHAWLVDTDWLWGCPGSALKGGSDCKAGVINVRSITVYSTVDTNAIVTMGAECSEFSQHHQCSRRITTSDTGLSENYRYFYGWILAKCDGKKSCDAVSVPPWWDLIGETNNPVEFDYKNGTVIRADCPLGGTKYISGVLVHVDCRADEDLSTKPTLPPTTPRTRPTTPTTTTMFPVFFAVYLPGLEPREKIILGVAIGLAIVILIVLLTILYCWERWRKQKKFGKLLRMLGRPQAADDGFDELQDYGTAEAWRGEADHPDAIGEYTGVKPDEFLTLDKKHMEQSGMIYSDHVGTITTMGRGNTASTLNKNGNINTRPSIDPSAGFSNGAPIDYNTDENLELERRMAAALSTQETVLGDTDGQEVSKH